MDLGFGNAASRSPRKGADIYSGYSSKTIATKYPEVTKQFSTARKWISIVKSNWWNSRPCLNSYAVDIVETGTTLVENGLEVVEYIADLSARLITNPASLKSKAAIRALTKRLKENL